MKLDLSKLQLSNHDRRQNITFPSKLSPELAELIGIIIGDGHLSVIKRKNHLVGNFTQSTVFIAGNKEEQQYNNYISSLFKRIFNCDLSYREDKRSKAILLAKYSKGIVRYFHDVCEVPLGRKTLSARVPSIILQADSQMKAAFLRGLADTDFYVSFKNKNKKGYSYPVIVGSFRSEQLIRDLEKIYTSLGFTYSCCYNLQRTHKIFGRYVMHSIYLNGKKNFQKWVEIVSFSNGKNSLKVKEWRLIGECSPKKEAPGEI